MESFYLHSNEQLTNKVASGGLSVYFLNFNGNDEKFDGFMFMKTFNLSHLTGAELDKLASNIPEIKQVSFDHVNQVLHEKNENDPF